MQCREVKLLPQQRLLELKKVRLDLQAAEDSNDSGLSSEHSANSSNQDQSNLYQLDFPQNITHFSKEYNQYNQPRRPIMAKNPSDKLRHREPYGNDLLLNKSSRRLPRSPSVENQNMSVPSEAAPVMFRQKTCGIDQDDVTYSNNFNSFSRVQRHLDYSSDSELHQTALDYASRRRSGDIYSSSGGASHSQKQIRSFQMQQQQAQAEANSIYWSQKLQSLTLQQEDAARRAAAAAVASSTFAASGPPTHRNLQRQRSYDMQTDEHYADQQMNGNCDYSGWISERDELAYSFPEHSSTMAPSPGTLNYSGRRAADTFPMNTKSDSYVSAAAAALANLTTKKDVLAMRGTQKFNVKDWERARFAAKYNKEDFRLCNQAVSNSATSPGWLSKSVDGLVYIHVIAGVGLHSSHALVRDFYCVIETDKVRKARTMIRTSTECFEWDELFDLELNSTRHLAFSLYQWDSRSKHRLCYYATLDLVTLLESFRQRFLRSEKLVLKLQPKGLLYLEMSYLEVSELYQRLPALRPGAYFGAPLDTVVRRDGGGLGIPLLVHNCLIEVEKRGLDIVGIYRLSASTRCRQQLREAFEQQPHEVDLSSDKVSDVHIVTGLLRDYLRSLPEPLFTNSLYRMVLDAMHVSLPGDPRGVAKLMLSILDCLPPPNQNTLLALLDHLKKIISRSEVNRMTTTALAMSFGPVLLYPSSTAARNLDSSLLHLDRMTEVLKYLLDIWASNRSEQKASNDSNYELSQETRHKVLDNSFEPPFQSSTFRGRQKLNRPISEPGSQELRRSSFNEQDSKTNSESSSARQFKGQFLRTASQEGRSVRVKHIVC